MRVTIEQIAAYCGVSVATVSRVIANKDNVSAKTRDKVLKRMLEVDYATDKVSKLIDQNRRNAILFLAENIDRSSNVTLFRSVSRTFEEFNYATVLYECNDAEKRNNAIEHAKALYSGCVVISGSSGNAGLGVFENDKFPLVAIHWCNDFGKVNSVIDDLRRASYLAVKHMVKNGHRNIALASSGEAASGNIEIIDGYKQACREFGLDYDKNRIYHSDLSTHSGYDIIKRVITENEGITGMVCANQDIVRGAMFRLFEEHMSVPGDMSFIALNVDDGKDDMIKITSSGSSSKRIGELAARMLYDLINCNSSLGLPCNAKIVLDPEVVPGCTVRNLNE